MYRFIIGILLLTFFLVACQQPEVEEEIPFIEQFNARFVEEALPPEEAWDLDLCLTYADKVDEKGFYVELPTREFKNFCDGQQMCESENCTYFSQLRSQRLKLNLEENERRLAIVRTGITPSGSFKYPHRTSDDAMKSTTEVFIWFNTSRLNWQAVPNRIVTEWIPVDVADASACAFVWAATEAELVGNRNLCYLNMAQRSQDPTLCDSIEGDATLETICKNQ